MADKTTILVGYASCGIAAGAKTVRALLENKVEEIDARTVSRFSIGTPETLKFF